MLVLWAIFLNFLFFPCCFTAMQNCGGRQSVPNFTEENVQTTKKAIVDLLADKPELGAKFLRIAFHDCCGICDGCIDTSDASLKPLGPAAQALLDNHAAKTANLPAHVGDIYHLAGMVAVEEGIKRFNKNYPYCGGSGKGCMPEPKFGTFSPGRIDCSETPRKTDEKEQLPSLHNTTEQYVELFNKNFGLNPQEFAAIMGAHSLGGITTGNGLRTFTLNPLLFSTDYYQDMLKNNYRAFKEPTFQILWGLNDQTARLNVDICLVKNITYTSSNNEPVIKEQNAMLDSSLNNNGLFQSFISKPETFLSNFASAYNKIGSRRC